MDQFCVSKERAAIKRKFWSHREVYNLKNLKSTGKLFLILLIIFWIFAMSVRLFISKVPLIGNRFYDQMRPNKHLFCFQGITAHNFYCFDTVFSYFLISFRVLPAFVAFCCPMS